MQEHSHCNCGERYSFNEARMLSAYTLHCHKVNSYYCSPRSTHALAPQSSTGGTARQLAQAMFTAHRSPFPIHKPKASLMLRTTKAKASPAIAPKPLEFQERPSCRGYFFSFKCLPFKFHSTSQKRWRTSRLHIRLIKQAKVISNTFASILYLWSLPQSFLLWLQNLLKVFLLSIPR